MANEIQADYGSGNTLYAIIRDRTGRVWRVNGQAFEDWGTDGHTADDYDVPLADKGGSKHVGDFDVNVPAGGYDVQVFLQAGANPANTDTLVSARTVTWTGTAELTTTGILANRAVYDKVAGLIDYYDDEGQAVIFTHTINDTAAAMTRAPD
jgi:hypothetical protein